MPFIVVRIVTNNCVYTYLPPSSQVLARFCFDRRLSVCLSVYLWIVQLKVTSWFYNIMDQTRDKRSLNFGSDRRHREYRKFTSRSTAQNYSRCYIISNDAATLTFVFWRQVSSTRTRPTCRSFQWRAAHICAIPISAVEFSVNSPLILLKQLKLHPLCMTELGTSSSSRYQM